jgi:nucleoside-diphosphate-sugar epimerase
LLRRHGDDIERQSPKGAPMPPITGPLDGPVAVTGASGYIGSHVVRNLVEAGYTVRASVRDASRQDKTEFLRAMNDLGAGSVEIFAADLLQAAKGAYDEVFAGCSAVFHVAADLRTDPAYGDGSQQRTYDAIMDGTRGVLASCRAARTVKRVLYTSSCAAVWSGWQGGRDASGREFTEDDWGGLGSDERLWNVEKQAYAKGKVDAEKYGYAWGEETGIDVVSNMPSHVLGPILNKTQNNVWQKRIGEALAGHSGHEPSGTWTGLAFPQMFLWNIIDVRDIAQAQRLMATSRVAGNGSRYILGATDESGELTARELRDTLSELFPRVDVCGGWEPTATPDFWHTKCTRAIRELGLKTHPVLDTLQSTGDSLIEFGVVEPARK